MRRRKPKGPRYRGGVDVVFKFVTLFCYEFFTTLVIERETVRNAAMGHVSMISANVNTNSRQNANFRQNMMTARETIRNAVREYMRAISLNANTR